MFINAYKKSIVNIVSADESTEYNLLIVNNSPVGFGQ